MFPIESVNGRIVYDGNAEDRRFHLLNLQSVHEGVMNDLCVNLALAVTRNIDLVIHEAGNFRQNLQQTGIQISRRPDSMRCQTRVPGKSGCTGIPLFSVNRTLK